MSVSSIGSSTTLLQTAASSKVVTDPRDTNKDGKVSEQELQAWALKHPDAAKQPDGSKPPPPPAASTPSSQQTSVDISV